MVEANKVSVGIEIIKIPSFGFLRLKQVLSIIPISKSQWWDGVKSGRFPAKIKLGARTTAWKVRDIMELAKRFELGQVA